MKKISENTLTENDQVKERLRKLEELRGKKINPYPYHFDQKNHAIELLQKYADLKTEEKISDNVSIAGRIVSLRRMGKATFLHLLDGTGKIQAYLREDTTLDYSLLKYIDIGDWIGINGNIFKTKTGEITVDTKNFQLLAKSLRPLPEKFHGLQDKEIRYRQRYLDLIMNPEVKQVFITRAKILEIIRDFMKKNNFIEIESPLLQPIYGGAYAKPFKTHCDAFDSDVFLSIAPELYHKKCLVGGFERVYEITKKFRNEGIDKQHNPEHMTIEWYQAYADYEEGMRLFEALMKEIAMKLFGTCIIEYQGNKIDLSKWRRLTLEDAIKEYLSIDITKINTDEDAKKIARTLGIDANGITKNNIADELMKLFREKLIQPVFLIDYPIELVPLGKVKRNNQKKAEIFQPFVAGIELARGYSELNDPHLQAEHFRQQEEERKRGNKEAMPTDKDFVIALEYGMPPACGVGIGIERLVMLFTNQISIRDVILFPFMKPENK